MSGTPSTFARPGTSAVCRIALYLSSLDWYDADFGPCANHPVQIPSAAKYDTRAVESKEALGKLIWIAPDPSKAEVDRMLGRHRAQLEELLTNYGQIDMISGWVLASAAAS